MKKFASILFLWSCLSSSYGQDILFSETCGSTDVSSAKKVDIFTGWDNPAPVTFTRTTTLDGYADVRSTATLTNHVWFPSGKSSDLIISNIPVANHKNLKLSVDIATYKLVDANVNKLKISCNDSPLTLPDGTFTSTKFIPVTNITLPQAPVLNLRFQYTAESNTNGYRLDNFTITGDKITSEPNAPLAEDFRLIISNNQLSIPGFPDGTKVEIFNTTSTAVLLSTLRNGLVEFNPVKKGLYLVRVDHITRKIILE